MPADDVQNVVEASLSIVQITHLLEQRIAAAPGNAGDSSLMTEFCQSGCVSNSIIIVNLSGGPG